MNWTMKDTKGHCEFHYRKGLLNLIKSYSTSLTFLTYVLVIFICHFCLSRYVFSCPCYFHDLVMTSRAGNSNDLTKLHQRATPQGRLFYAVSFMVWPALISWIIALVINGNTKRCLMNSGPHCGCRRHCHDVIYLLRHTGITVIVPLTWVALTFLDGRVYECLVSAVPGPCLPSEVKQQHVLVALEKENQQLRTFSQALGLSLLGIAFASIILVSLCYQLINKKTYYEDCYLSLYRQKELEVFKEVAEELIDHEVTKNWRTFFRKARKRSDWDDVAYLSSANSEDLSEKVVGSSLACWCTKSPKTSVPQPPRPLPPPGALNEKDKDTLNAIFVQVEEQGKQKLNTEKEQKNKDIIKRESISRDYAMVTNEDLLASIITECKQKHSVRFNDEKEKNTKQDDNNSNNNYDAVGPAYCIPQKANSKSVAVQAAPDTPMLKRREVKKTNDKGKVNEQGHPDYDNHIFKQNDCSNAPSRLSMMSEASSVSGMSTVSTVDYESPDSEDSDLSLTSVTTTSSSIHFISTANDDLRPIVSRPSLPHKPSNVVNAIGVNSTVVKKGYVQSLIEKQNCGKKEPGPQPERTQSLKNK